MPPPGYKQQVLAVLPATSAEVMLRAHVSTSTARRHIAALRKQKLVYISGWIRSGGAFAAIYSRGDLPDARCRLKAEGHAVWVKRCRKKQIEETGICLAVERDKARKREERRLKRKEQTTWLSALGL